MSCDPLPRFVDDARIDGTTEVKRTDAEPVSLADTILGGYTDVLARIPAPLDVSGVTVAQARAWLVELAAEEEALESQIDRVQRAQRAIREALIP